MRTVLADPGVTIVERVSVRLPLRLTPEPPAPHTRLCQLYRLCQLRRLILCYP
ncbi:hypothetical protein GCM10018785_15330 [Streptomyces longispororuber]|uniref:Uncharacterized protein n=1 Tax=Streptomyces longispororuber TaxID=68230 RepID=A0A918ZDB4_9ACTN|nr:hypothetical protein [Streptomyces longispororuber]GHE46590.1 hypothetical protein GCM10018785_15330 [Streptomyces longispororuber]